MDKKQASIVECLLFVAGEPVLITELARVLELDEASVKTLLYEMETTYRDDGRGICLMTTDDTAQLVSNRDYINYVEALLQPEQKRNVSQSILETLAVIAYKQPCIAIVYLNGAYQRVDSTLVNGKHQFVLPAAFADDESALVYIAVTGDANGDGTVSSKDSTEIKAFRANILTLNEVSQIASDANKDNKVTSKDATLIDSSRANLAEILW